jgi:hypothetical protein
MQAAGKVRVVPTYPLFRGLKFWHGGRGHVSARQSQEKDGKQHRYFSVVENRRVRKNKTAQRTVLYLGEINDGREATWRKTLQVFDESQQQHTTLSLFPRIEKFRRSRATVSKSN